METQFDLVDYAEFTDGWSLATVIPTCGYGLGEAMLH